MVTLRHRLVNAALETEVLSKIYKSLAIDMGYEDYHMYLRYVQFDFAKYKENASLQPAIYVSEATDESEIDRYFNHRAIIF